MEVWEPLDVRQRRCDNTNETSSGVRVVVVQGKVGKFPSHRGRTVYIYVHVTLVLFGLDAPNASLLIDLCWCVHINSGHPSIERAPRFSFRTNTTSPNFFFLPPHPQQCLEKSAENQSQAKPPLANPLESLHRDLRKPVSNSPSVVYIVC